MNRKVQIGRVYRHFKGFKATVITIATHTETGKQLVVYECTGAGNGENHKGGIYARPLEMFLSEVDHDKYPDVKQKYRFELITDFLKEPMKPTQKNIAQSGLAPATENFELLEG